MNKIDHVFGGNCARIPVEIGIGTVKTESGKRR
jgi:hypothetical protein